MELGIIRGIIYSRRYEHDWRGKQAHINIILLVKFDGFQVSSVNSVTPANLSHVYLKRFEIRDIPQRASISGDLSPSPFFSAAGSNNRRAWALVQGKRNAC